MQEPTDKQVNDVVVIGGGPAGLSAAAWCSELGLSTILLEKRSEFGGQLLSIHNAVTNYLGIAARDGREMQAHFVASVADSEFRRRTHVKVTAIDAGSRMVVLDDGSHIQAKAIIIATGVRRRSLGIPGEVEFRGRGVLDSGAGQRMLTEGKDVIVVGGGDAAIENALILSEFARRITVVHRRDTFSARDEFITEAQSRSNVEFLTSSELGSITGGDSVRSVTVRHLQTGAEKIVDTDFVLVRIGVVPNTEFLADTVRRDDEGYVIVNSLGETNLDGIYAVGDVANPTSPTIATAVGTGATTAKHVHYRFRKKLMLI